VRATGRTGIVLDVDSSESPTYGGQEGSAYNGHFGCTCYHPLIVVNQFGDLERCSLRPDNAHCAKGWRDVLEPVIVRYPSRGLVPYFRGDAASAKPEFYELLEAEGIDYAIRLPANPVLQERIAHLLTRPAGHALKVDRARRKPRTDPRCGLTSLTPTVAPPLASLPVDEQPFEEHRRT